MATDTANLTLAAGQRLITKAIIPCNPIDDDDIWINTQNVMMITEDTPCGLCDETFSKANPPHSLHCGHVYHKKCIRDDLTAKVDDYFTQNQKLPSSLSCPGCGSDPISEAVKAMPIADSSISDKVKSASDTVSSFVDSALSRVKSYGLKVFDWIKSLPTHELPLYVTIGTILTMPFPILSTAVFATTATLMLANQVLNIDTRQFQNDRIDQYKSARMILTTLLTGLAVQNILYTVAGVTAYFLPLLGTVGAIYGGIYVYENYIREG